MYHLNTTLYAASVFKARTPIFTASPVTRHIRIKTSNDGDTRPPDGPGNATERKDQQLAGSLDPQVQNAKTAMGAPMRERPAYVHGRVNQNNGTGDVSSQTGGHAAAGWWEWLKKQVLGGRWWRKKPKDWGPDGGSKK